MKVVVFDLDDTLYKEVDYVKSAFRYIEKHLGCTYGDGVYEVMWNAFLTKEDVVKVLNEKFGEIISKEQYLEWYRYHTPNIAMESSAIECMGYLKNNNTIMGIITDGRTTTQMNKVKALGLLKYVEEDDIVISERFGSQKPSMSNYSYFMDKYGKADYYYIGDNPSKDFVAPNQLGWTTVCLMDDGRNIHKQDFTLEDIYLPKIRIDSLEDLFV